MPTTLEVMMLQMLKPIDADDDASDFTIKANAKYLSDGATEANANDSNVTDVNVDADSADVKSYTDVTV